MDRFVIKKPRQNIVGAAAAPSTVISVENHEYCAAEEDSTNFNVINDTSLEQDACCSFSGNNLNADSDSDKRKRAFREEWKHIFSWVDKRDENAYCTVCNKSLFNLKSNLERHDKNSSHIKNYEQKKGQITIENSFRDPKKELLSKQIHDAELTLTMFCIMHHLPFLLMDFLPDLLVKCCPDSLIARNINCSRTKATYLTTNVLSKMGLEETCKYLRTGKFSIIVDETTDVSCSKALAIVARTFDAKYQNVRDRFLGLIKLTKTDAESIFNAILNLFEDLSIPVENMIGLASDNAAVMIGTITGLHARFREINSCLFHMKCICHSLHLCSNSACKKLPFDIEKLARDIFNFFAHSSKRCIEFQGFQEYLSIKPHKILGLSQTRWLSLEGVVTRILEQWSALQLYFISSVLEDSSDRAKNLAERLYNPYNKIYFLFLSYILKTVNKMNMEFQSENLRLHLLHETMMMNYRNILSCFIKTDIMKHCSSDSLNSIDVYDENNYLSLNRIFMGSAVETFLSSADTEISEDDLLVVRKNILSFYIELARQIQSRYDLNDTTLKHLSILNPEVAVSGKYSIMPLVNAFPNLVPISIRDELVDEYRLLSTIQTNGISDLNMTTPEVFWPQLALKKDVILHPVFKYLPQFMMDLMSLPHSSAAAERIFSDLNLTKTKLRNRLELATISSIMSSKELLSSSDKKIMRNKKKSKVWKPP